MRTHKFEVIGLDVARIREVARICGLSTGEVWTLSKTDNDFPRPIFVTPQLCVWDVAAVRKWHRADVAKRCREIGFKVKDTLETAVLRKRVSANGHMNGHN